MNAEHSDLPLSGVLVLDMCQFLSGPYCSLRLQDLGARVIKIERPGLGDLSRRLYLSDTEIGGDSTIFHAINRSKESLAIDMKDPDDLAALKTLIGKANVVLQNFRPGVIQRIGLDYDTLKQDHPGLVYGSITGYGDDGPWVSRPGQDLLAQARSGVMWLNGDDGQGPVPFGLAIADMLAGAALAQGVLAALVRQGRTGKGAHVETSLLEAMIDFQFEVLTTHLNDGERPPKRSAYRSAHAYLSAPYGVYPTADGYLALAMMPVDQLADVLQLDALGPYRGKPDLWFTGRDDIKRIIAQHFATGTTDQWLAVLEPADIWCSKVLDWPELMNHAGFKVLDMLQTVTREDGVSIRTTRSPLRVDGKRMQTDRAAPKIGEQSASLRAEFKL
nr:CaiB/BaiF CoA-transferase family protein [Marinicella sp. W31]MDC2878440.1 CaiB/BaiF CoA-transferase family protein [Marinicella sp. W31]